MNDLTNIGSALTMSSREIAELTGKVHKNVLADIRGMVKGLGITPADFSAYIKVAMPNGGFRTEKAFNLPKRETLILVSGYDVLMRAKIIDRWQELEGREQPTQHQIPQTRAEALRLAADLEEQNIKLVAQIEEDRPKVEFHDVVTQSDQALTVAEAAKVLGTGEKRLFKLLRDRAYILKNSTAPAQKHVNRGLFQYKISTYNTPSGFRSTHVQALVTGKGIAYLQRHYFRMQGQQMDLRFNPNPLGSVRDGTVGDRIIKHLRRSPGRNFSESELVEELGERARGSVSFALQRLRFYGHVESIPSPVNPRYFVWRIRNEASWV